MDQINEFIYLNNSGENLTCRYNENIVDKDGIDTMVAEFASDEKGISLKLSLECLLNVDADFNNIETLPIDFRYSEKSDTINKIPTKLMVNGKRIVFSFEKECEGDIDGVLRITFKKGLPLTIDKQNN